jgi:tetratricopeptide (TPR) repeat protein
MNRTIGKTRWLRALLALGVTLALGTLVAAQSSGQGQQNPPKPPTQPGQTPPQNPPAQPAQPENAAPPVNKEEEDAYKAFFEAKGSDTQGVIKLGEDFLKKFAESRYREGVYSKLANAYLSAGEEEKMFAAGQKALELNPNNVDVLALMAYVLPRRVNPDALDKDQRLDKSERYSKQAITLVESMPKPATLSDEDFAKAKNDKLSMCHSGLGFVYFHRQKFADSATEFEQATKLAAQPEPSDFFIMGIDLEQMKQFGDASAAYGHCGDLQWAWQDRCKKKQEETKKLAAAQPQPPKQ